MSVPKLFYIACSSYSGSTLLSFLLNTHEEICTVGHMVGWPEGNDENFLCSCGEPLKSCPFFGAIRDAFRDARLPFDYSDFGTKYELVRNDRLNRYLNAGLPLIHSNRAESLRDAVVSRMPGFAGTLARFDRANLTFVNTALAHSGARVFVDNSHSPHRVRHLSRIPELDIAAAHLVRDLRGVVLSDINRRGWDAEFSTRMWLREQSDVARVLGGRDKAITIYYEQLCEATDETLATLHRLVGLEPQPFPGDFKATDHHILGNAMRLRDSKISADRRWERDLSQQDLATITRVAESFVRRDPDHPVSRMVEHYFSS